MFYLVRPLKHPEITGRLRGFFGLELVGYIKTYCSWGAIDL